MTYRPALLLLCLSLGACSYADDPGPRGVADIVRVDQDPDTVRVGGQMRLHMVVIDSLDTTLRYRWTMSAGLSGAGRTYVWTAPDTPGTYFHYAAVSGPFETTRPSVRLAFSTVVVP